MSVISSTILVPQTASGHGQLMTYRVHGLFDGRDPRLKSSTVSTTRCTLYVLINIHNNKNKNTLASLQLVKRDDRMVL